MGRVDLDVGGPQAGQLLDLLAQDGDHVGQELLDAGIGAARALRRPEIGEQAGAGQGHLGDARGPRPQVDELLGAEVPLALELADHAQLGRPRAAPIPDRLCAVPLAPQEGVQVPGAEAVHGLGHPALERHPAHLAVGEHLQAGRLLERDRLIDGAVLDRLELGVGDATGGVVPLRLEQLGRPEQAADDIGMGRDHDERSLV